MNVRKDHTPWIISAKLSHRHNLPGRTETVYLARNQYKEGAPMWVDDPSPASLFYGTQAEMEKRVEWLNLFYKPQADNSFDEVENWFYFAAKYLSDMGQKIIIIELEQVCIMPVKQWDFKGGQTNNGKVAKNLHALWKDAYACFKAVLDTPIARRKIAGEYPDELRQRMQEIDETIKPTVIN